LTARSLLVVFDSVYLLALAAWLGSILFFSFALAPNLFKVLGVEAGEKLARALLPRYYLWGAVCGALMLPSAVAVPLAFPEMRGPWVGVQALAIMAATLLSLYGGNTLTPAINAARDLGPSGEERFNRLHRRAVRLNMVVLLIGLGLLVGFAARRAPRSAGIIEPSPEARAAEAFRTQATRRPSLPQPAR
jgi:hypothetical protein